MVRNSKQKWEVGQTVNVGFVRGLVVKAAIVTPADGLPDVYFLANRAGDKLYEFTPHNGLRRADLDDVCARVATFRAHCEQVTAAVVDKASKAATITRKFNELFAEAA